MSQPIDGTNKYLLLLDLSVAGHHPTYIRRLLESDLSKFTNIILASRKEMFSHAEIRPLAHRFTAHEIKAPDFAVLHKDFTAANLIRGSWTIGKLYRDAYRYLARRMQIEFVVVPFLDDCLLGLSLPKAPFAATPWLAITMRTMFHFGEMGIRAPQQRLSGVRRYLFERILRQSSMTAVLTIDPTLATFAARQRAPHYKRIEYLPDPALRHAHLPSKLDARRGLDISLSARVILLYGEIAARKGVFNLLDAAADPACDDQLHVLLAGRHENSHLMLKSPAYLSLAAQGRIHRLEGFVDDEGERTVLAAADCMWVGYQNFYLMSGIMVLAGRHGLPVIATAGGLIGYWTQQHDLGVVVDVDSRATIVAALNHLTRHPQDFESMGRHGISAFSEHEPAAMQKLVIEQFMRSRHSPAS